MENAPITQKPVVLAIDDFTMSLLLIKNALSEIARVFAVKSAKTAILTLDSINVIDLILLDLEMPDMSGYEFLEFLKNSSDYKNIPVIVISSSCKSLDKNGFEKYNIVDFIGKPFQASVLLEKTKKILLTKKGEKNNSQ